MNIIDLEVTIIIIAWILSICSVNMFCKLTTLDLKFLDRLIGCLFILSGYIKILNSICKILGLSLE